MAEKLANLSKGISGEQIETDTYNYLSETGNYIQVTKLGRVCTFYINSGITNPYPSGTALFNYLPAKYRPATDLVFVTCMSALSPNVVAQVVIQKSTGSVYVNTNNLGYAFCGAATYITQE